MALTPFTRMEDRGFDLEDRLSTLEEREVKRTLSPADRVAERGYFAAPSGGELPVLESDEALVFASNNYLGLTANQRVQDAARQAAATVGTGAGASRPVTGDTLVHHDLERLLAETKGCDRTLTFSSGYAAALGTTTALDPDVIFADELNHAALADGCRFSGAETIGYDHRDVADLRSKLEARAEQADAHNQADDRNGTDDSGDDGESWLIVTDSVFDVDGTVAPLAAICDLAEEFGAWVLVDETHATGLYVDGGGVVQADGLEDAVDVQVGALSTALASQGGYVAGSNALIECLINDARSFTSSAGLAPPAAAAASEALHVSRHGDVRERLWENVAHLRDGLETMGFEVAGDSQILPVIADGPEDATALVDGLQDRAIVASAVRPSALPDERGRVRITPIAAHGQDEIVACLEAFRAVGDELGLL